MAFKIQLKHGSGWFAVEADDYDRFFTDLCVVFGQDRADTIIREIQEQPAEAAAPAAPAAPPAPPSAPPAPPAPPAAPAARTSGQPPADWESNAPFCEHGQRRARQWSRDGRENYTWFCPLGQDRRSEQCRAIDAVTGKEFGGRR